MKIGLLYDSKGQRKSKQWFVNPQFFKDLGFTFNPNFGNYGESISLLIGDKNLVVMLFQESTFESFTNHRIVDTSQASEVLLSIGTESKTEVDDLARKVVLAGGTVFAESMEKG